MHKLICFNEVDSTNAYAKKNAFSLNDQTVILSEKQTAGRGRLSRKWESEEGGLYFSIFLKPKTAEHSAVFTQLMCLSLCKTLEMYGLTPVIKWPNDVLIEGKKISGVLGEAILEGAQPAVVLGAGVNIGQQNINVENAISLKMLDLKVEKETFLNALLDNFFMHYPQVVVNGFSVIKAQYLHYYNGAAGQILDDGTAVLNGQKNFTGD